MKVDEGGGKRIFGRYWPQGEKEMLGPLRKGFKNKIFIVNSFLCIYGVTTFEILYIIVPQNKYWVEKSAGKDNKNYQSATLQGKIIIFG